MRKRRTPDQVRDVIDDLRRENPHPPITDWPKQALDWDEDVPEPEEGGGWIQWKGTSVCMDVHCRCGAHIHVDGAEFLYFIRCPACETTFAVGSTVRLYAVDEEYANRRENNSASINDRLADRRADVNVCTRNSTAAKTPCECEMCGRSL